MASAGKEEGLPVDHASKMERRLQSRMSALRHSYSMQDAAEWHCSRQMIFKIVDHSKFENLIGAVICFNVVLIIMETNANAECRYSQSQCNVPWLAAANIALLAIYTMEAMARIYAYRWLILRRRWDIFDVIVVLFSYMELMLDLLKTAEIPGVQLLRIFRVAKLLRAARVLRVFPELNTMLEGFVSAMSAMVWGLMMILVLTLMWAIMAVEFIQPVALELFDDGSFCAESFNGVLHNMLLLFQTLVAGDSWGNCAMPLIERAPVSAVFFAISLVMIQIGLTNLILAVVVEKAAEAHAADMERQQKGIVQARVAAEDRLTEMCEDIDVDEDGAISLDELLGFFETSEELRGVFTTLDIQKDDVESLFMLMDKDGSGDLTYQELVSCIHRSDTNDLKRQIMVLKLQMQDVWVRIRNQVQSNITVMQQDMAILVSNMEVLLSQKEHSQLKTAGLVASDMLASETFNQTGSVRQDAAKKPSGKELKGKTESSERAVKGDLNKIHDQLNAELLTDAAFASEAIDAEMTRIRRQLDDNLAALAKGMWQRQGISQQEFRDAKLPLASGGRCADQQAGSERELGPVQGSIDNDLPAKSNVYSRV